MASTRHPRSRTGCWICRLRKKKCDETRPTCQQCRNLRIQCDGYGVAQPAWMRDPAAAKGKKEEIKLQIGKRGRRRRKALARLAEELESEEMGDESENTSFQDDNLDLGHGFAVEGAQGTNEGEGTAWENGNGQQFSFETVDGGIQLLKLLQETPKRYATGPGTLLDSSHPPIGCYRCPVKNSFARSIQPEYDILDARTGKPLLQDFGSGVILMPTSRPFWRPTDPTDPNNRTKDEEIYFDEYDAIIASLMSLTTPSHYAPPSPAELEDPSLVPPIHFANPHEVTLVKHYIRNVFRLTFSGMLEARIHRSLRDVIIPLFTASPGFLKGCLSSSAIHLAAIEGKSQARVKALFADAWEFRVGCIRDLKTRLGDEGASERTLASILALTSFEALSSLSDWEPHLKIAIECLVKLDFLNRPTHSASSKFLMSRIVWLDILSALTLGRAPQLWANYREILSRPANERAYCGLLDMMGCDDTVMFLVSEVMCVEDYKYQTLGDGMISWTRGTKRAIELDIRLRNRDLPVTVNLPPSPEPPFPSLQPPDEDDSDEDDPTLLASSPPTTIISPTQSPEPAFDNDDTSTPHHPFPLISNTTYQQPPLSPETTPNTTIITSAEPTPSEAEAYNDHFILPDLQADQGMITKATTAAFRTATRIHLWSIGLGFYPRLSFFQQLLEELIIMVALIPAGLSRTVAWPLLVGGCMATELKDREFFAGRCGAGRGGSLEGVERVMRGVWKRRDETDRVMGVGCGQEVHWRSVMKEEGLEILLL